MTGNDQERLGITRNYQEWPEMTRNDQNWPGMTRNDRWWMEMTKNGWEKPGQPGTTRILGMTWNTENDLILLQMTRSARNKWEWREKTENDWKWQRLNYKWLGIIANDWMNIMIVHNGEGAETTKKIVNDWE